MDKDLFSLSGTVAVVTGAARGLGKAAALGMADFGADVAAIDLSSENCRATQTEIEKMGRRCASYGCNIAISAQVRATVDKIVADFGRIDILINIAGVTARVPTERIPEEQVRRLTDVNYFGTFWCCQEVGKVMIRQGRGNIINMSALGGAFLGMGRGNAAYSSTKGAIAALTRDLACEWASKGIRVNAVAPCWFQTDMNATSIFAKKSFMDQLMTKLPMRRIGRPADLIGPLVFLASDASAMITGLILPVDGGAAATCPITWEE